MRIGRSVGTLCGTLLLLPAPAEDIGQQVDRLAEDVFRLLAGQHVEPRSFTPHAAKGP